ncbi:MAG: HEPN domain-containing protein [Balneolaceae bacterium]
MTADVQTWLNKAEEDWLSAEWLLQEDSPVVTPALFHLQQCAEKLLKAYLIKCSVEFERKHDLGYLLQLTDEDALRLHEDLLDELTPFAVELRYPGDLPVISKGDARSLLARVGEFRVTLLRTIEKGRSEEPDDSGTA